MCVRLCVYTVVTEWWRCDVNFLPHIRIRTSVSKILVFDIMTTMTSVVSSANGRNTTDPLHKGESFLRCLEPGILGPGAISQKRLQKYIWEYLMKQWVQEKEEEI